MLQLVVWTLDGQRYALPFSEVERVVRAVEITPLPDAPTLVSGIINMQGQIVPVVNMRLRLGLPEHDVSLADQIVLAHASTRLLAFVVDTVIGVAEYSAKTIVDIDSFSESGGCIAGVLKLADGMMLIHDLDKLLSADDERSLDRALSTV